MLKVREGVDLVLGLFIDFMDKIQGFQRFPQPDTGVAKKFLVSSTETEWT